MVLHTGIANEMEIHFSVLLISRYAKMSDTQRETAEAAVPPPAATRRPSEIKGESSSSQETFCFHSSCNKTGSSSIR